MKALLTVVCICVALQHVGFLVLEMFLWNRTIGRKVFRTTPEFAAQSSGMAANQGLYNGFLAAGLLWGAFHPAPDQAFEIEVFFFACVAVAGACAHGVAADLLDPGLPGVDRVGGGMASVMFASALLALAQAVAPLPGDGTVRATGEPLGGAPDGVVVRKIEYASDGLRVVGYLHTKIN